MSLKWFLICPAVAGFLGAGTALCEELVIKLQRFESQSCYPAGPGSVQKCSVAVRAGSLTPVYSASDLGPQDISGTIEQKKAERETWINDTTHIFSVYTTNEVYSKSETFTRAEVNKKIDSVYAEIDARLAALKVGEADKQAILEALRVSLEPTIAELEKTMTDRITQSVLGQLKEAGALQ